MRVDCLSDRLGTLPLWSASLLLPQLRPHELPCALCSVASAVSDSATPMDCSPPGSSVHGISQARILEWVAMSFSNSCASGFYKIHLCSSVHPILSLTLKCIIFSPLAERSEVSERLREFLQITQLTHGRNKIVWLCARTI